jgi:hypothetical protein
MEKEGNYSTKLVTLSHKKTSNIAVNIEGFDVIKSNENLCVYLM